jgi:prevent-host-death family protein
MTPVRATDLARQTAEMVDQVERTRRPILVFRNGRPVAALVALDQDKLGDYILANAPSFVASLDQTDDDGRHGRLCPTAAVLNELQDGHSAATSR